MKQYTKQTNCTVTNFILVKDVYEAGRYKRLLGARAPLPGRHSDSTTLFTQEDLHRQCCTNQQLNYAWKQRQQRWSTYNKDTSCN